MNILEERSVRALGQVIGSRLTLKVDNMKFQYKQPTSHLKLRGSSSKILMAAILTFLAPILCKADDNVIYEESFNDFADGASLVGQSNWIVGSSADGQEYVGSESSENSGNLVWNIKGRNFYVINSKIIAEAETVVASFKIKANHFDHFQFYVGQTDENAAIVQFDEKGDINIYNGEQKNYIPVGSYTTGTFHQVSITIRIGENGAEADLSVDGNLIAERIPVLGKPERINFIEFYSQCSLSDSVWTIDDFKLVEKD